MKHKPIAVHTHASTNSPIAQRIATIVLLIFSPPNFQQYPRENRDIHHYD